MAFTHNVSGLLLVRRSTREAHFRWLSAPYSRPRGRKIGQKSRYKCTLIFLVARGPKPRTQDPQGPPSGHPKDPPGPTKEPPDRQPPLPTGSHAPVGNGWTPLRTPVDPPRTPPPPDTHPSQGQQTPRPEPPKSYQKTKTELLAESNFSWPVSGQRRMIKLYRPVLLLPYLYARMPSEFCIPRKPGNFPLQACTQAVARGLAGGVASQSAEGHKLNEPKLMRWRQVLDFNVL